MVHCLLNPLTRFLSTVPIASEDHKLIAITKQTTTWDGSLRLRSSKLSVLPRVWAMTSAEMTVSIAFQTAADSMTGQMKENSLSCIGSSRYCRGVTFSLPDFSLKQEVLSPKRASRQPI